MTKKKLECICLDLERVFFFFCLAVGGEARGTSSLRWPTPSDLNTRLRRIIAGYQRVVKKQELKKAAAEKVSVIISNSLFPVNSGSVKLNGEGHRVLQCIL